MSSGGRVEALWLKRAHRGVMDPVEAADFVQDEGIVDDANRGRSKRQVTLIEKEVFDAIAEDLPEVDPAMRRANILVSGVKLAESRHHVVEIGDVRIRIQGETRPCERMDAQLPGLTEALEPAWNGGAYGTVMVDGTVRVGDPVTIRPPDADGG